MELKRYYITKYSKNGIIEQRITVEAKGPKDALKKKFPDYAFEQYYASRNMLNSCKWSVGLTQKNFSVQSDCGKIWNYQVRNDYHNSLQGKTYLYSGRKDGKTIKELLLEEIGL